MSFFDELLGIQALLKRALAGKLDIASFWAVEAIYGKDIGYSAAEMKHRLSTGYVWFDIWSVPQIDTAKKKAATSLASPLHPLASPCTRPHVPTPFYTSLLTPTLLVQGGHPLDCRLHRDVVLAVYGARWPMDARERRPTRRLCLGLAGMVQARELGESLV